MNTLVVGGSSGLGLELARELAEDGQVIVTGRKDPRIDFAEFKKFDLTGGSLSERIKKFVADLPNIDCMVYAAGYYQEGRVTDLSDKEIEEMIDVCGRGLIYFAKALLDKQDKIAELITITSTSAWTPRQLEPIYNFAKAGAGHFTNAMAEDGRITKVMQVGPAGMATNFWAKTDHETVEMNDPAWVAGEVMKARQKDYRYKYIRVLRQPPRVEEVEER